MSLLYNRFAKVTVELKPVNGTTVFDSFIISGLRTQFTIEKTIRSTPNRISISIWNLSKATRDRMRNEGDNIILEVGYLGLPSRPGFTEVLAVGDLTFVDSNKQGPDWVTKLDCGDGAKANKFAQVNESFPPGTTKVDVMKKVIDKVKELVAGTENSNILFDIIESIRTATSNAEVPGTDDDGIIQQGLSLIGNAADALDGLTDKMGLEWSVQDGNVQITEVAADNGQPFILISPSTGLIGSPSRGENGSIKFRGLLLPKIRAGRRIRMQSNEINGDFKALTVAFDGDTHSQNWNTEVEAKVL